jgi:hypothetical protein
MFSYFDTTQGVFTTAVAASSQFDSGLLPHGASQPFQRSSVTVVLSGSRRRSSCDGSDTPRVEPQAAHALTCGPARYPKPLMPQVCGARPVALGDYQMSQPWQTSPFGLGLLPPSAGAFKKGFEVVVHLRRLLFTNAPDFFHHRIMPSGQRGLPTPGKMRWRWAAAASSCFQSGRLPRAITSSMAARVTC